MRIFVTLLIAVLLSALFDPLLSGPLYADSSESIKVESERQVTLPQKSVYTIPISGQIGKPTLFILRRALKEAIEKKVDVIVLDINTPGGGLNVTVDIMKALANFDGETVAYINDEAISAGAYIAIATNAIYFSPRAIIGAAAVIQGTGKDLDTTLKSKVDSYMRGNIARYAGSHPYRAEVMRAMMDDNYELVIDGEIISPKGELLTLWTKEAVKLYGDPPSPLLGAGVAESTEKLLNYIYGPGSYTEKKFEVSWSERVAQFVSPFIPVIIGIGMVALFIEFKTPGFGFFGIAGIIFLVSAFLSNYIVGLAGNEPILLFFLGVLLVGLEVFLFPGLIITALLGFCFILTALLLSMADIWPSVNEGIPKLSFGLFVTPIYNLLIALIVAFWGIVVALKLLPRTPFYKNLILEEPLVQTLNKSVPSAFSKDSLNLVPQSEWPERGATGVTVSTIHPGGEVEIEGKRYEASASRGSIAVGEKIIVVGYRDFSLVIDKFD